MWPTEEGGANWQAEGSQRVILNCRVTWLDPYKSWCAEGLARARLEAGRPVGRLVEPSGISAELAAETSSLWFSVLLLALGNKVDQPDPSNLQRMVS